MGVEDQILDAAVEAATVHGIERMVVADVAKRAGLSRATVYNHFATKDELVAAAVRREASALIEAVVAASNEQEDLREAVRVAVLTTLQLARRHPLLDRIVRAEPERLVPLLTTEGSVVLPVLRPPVEAVVAVRFPGIDPVAGRRFADVVVRLLVSYSLSAPDDPPEVVAAVVSGLLIDGAVAVADGFSLGGAGLGGPAAGTGAPGGAA
jgi:AcrR family transcriptional regulator